jgi:hypothetical protein
MIRLLIGLVALLLSCMAWGSAALAHEQEILEIMARRLPPELCCLVSEIACDSQGDL